MVYLLIPLYQKEGVLPIL